MHLENYGLTREAVARLVDAARAAGISEIGVTEHAYHFTQCRSIYPEDNRWIHGGGTHHNWDLDGYVRLLESSRDDGLPVKLGMEWDYCPGREADLERLISAYPWDFTLGSVHWLRGRPDGWWGFDLSETAAEWERRDPAAVYGEYFSLLADAARTGFFDILAHPDVVKIFGHKPAGGVTALYEEAGATMAAAGACAEVSTAGWRKPVRELYPAPPFLRVLREMEVPVVISSDAHTADEIGYAFDDAEAAAREAGYGTRCVFTRRRREEVPLPGRTHDSAHRIALP